MRKYYTLLVMAACLATPVNAADWGPTDSRASAFAGARLRIPLGGEAKARPEASLALAPMLSRRTAGGRLTSSFGRGVELGVANRQPELKLAGIRADQAVRMAQGKDIQVGQKSGLSTGAWIGIGAAVVVVGAIVFVTSFTCVGRDRDFCGSD